MPMINVKVQSLQDAANGMPIVEGLTKENTLQVELVTFGILQAGMKSGATSVMFHFKLPDGTNVIAEQSAALFNMMHSALTGAEQRFINEHPNNN